MIYTLITGATGGIGRAFSFQCAEKGYNLVLTGRSKEKLDLLKKEILEKHNVDVLTFACDLTSDTERENLFIFIDEKNIKLDNLINVAGVDTQKAFSDYTKGKVLFQLRVNAEATIMITHAFLSRRTEKSSIITISSMSGVSPMPYFALYSATKSMLTNFFTALRYEHKKEINITTVLPGGVFTRPDIINEIKSQGLWGKLSAKSPKYVAKGSLKAVRKNKAKYIPGFFNKLLYFFMKIAPKKLVLLFIAKRWKSHSKDAF